MQYLDDDINELFLKASEDIRLRAEDDDWDKIQKRLLPAVSLLPPSQASVVKRNSYRKCAYVFLVLLISGTTGMLLMSRTAARIEFSQNPGSIRIVKPEERRTTNAGNSMFLKPNVTQSRSSSEPSGEKKLCVQHISDQKNADPAPFAFSEPIGKIGDPVRLDLLNNIKLLKKHVDIIKRRGFYVEVLVGPQFSHTKQQCFSNAGFSAGLLAGFHLNNKLAIESGFIISGKQYSSAGEYFDMSKLSATMPAGMKLIQVQSKSTVLEIPVQMKYNLLKINHGNVFVTGGLSSYILTKESNKYLASLNGSEELLSGSYSKQHIYFAASINMSAGYEYKLAKGVNLRFEPYFQIPVKPIGMGSMHVMSAGVYLGITLPLVK